MWFNLVMANHGATASGEYLSPSIAYMRCALSKCGHETTVVQSEVYRHAVNVFFAFFSDPAFADRLLDIRRSDSLKVGIVATELIRISS